MSQDQRKKLFILMVNMFIAVGSFGIIIPILPAYLLSIGEGGKAAGLMIAIFAGAQLIMSPISRKVGRQVRTPRYDYSGTERLSTINVCLLLF